MGCYCLKKKLVQNSIAEYKLDEAVDLLNIYLNEQETISRKGFSALLSTELELGLEQANKVMEYALQKYNSYRYGYTFNSESDSFVKLKPLFEEDEEYNVPSESEFWFGVERISDYTEYLKKNERVSFSATSYRLYIAKMLKKKIRIESIIRYLNNEGLVTFVDDKTIYTHAE